MSQFHNLTETQNDLLKQISEAKKSLEFLERELIAGRTSADTERQIAEILKPFNNQ